MIWLALAVALCLSMVHVLASRLPFLDVIPRSRLLSAAGGVSVAYVFVHLFPELAELQQHVAEAAGPSLRWLDRHIYLLALASFAAFYGLEQVARASRRAALGVHGDEPEARVRYDAAAPPAPPAVFWVHMASFGVYNGLVGYLLLHREEPGVMSLLWFGIAMALHFAVNDHGLHDHHRDRYDRFGRWILAAAVLLGWGLALVASVGDATIGVLLALLSGGVVLNVIKEELPEERRSRWSAFAVGATAYAALLLLM